MPKRATDLYMILWFNEINQEVENSLLVLTTSITARLTCKTAMSKLMQKKELEFLH